MVVDKTVMVQRVSDRITVKEFYQNIYSPVYITTFYIAEEHETPFANGLRLRLGLDSARAHTTIVHDNNFVGSFLDSETRMDDNAGLSMEAQDVVRKKGYKILSFEEAVDSYEPDNVVATGLKYSLKREKRSTRW